MVRQIFEDERLRSLFLFDLSQMFEFLDKSDDTSGYSHIKCEPKLVWVDHVMGKRVSF